MKTKEELTALKEEVETLNKKLAELTEEELKQVTGGEIVPDFDEEQWRDDDWCRYNCKSFVFNTLDLNSPMCPKYCSNAGKNGVCFYQNR